MFKIKKGVNITGLCSEVILVAMVSNEVYRELDRECVITCGVEGKHRKNSKHYVGMALDLRTRHLSQQQVTWVAKTLNAKLNGDYDVVVHRTHIHVEFDPELGVNQ